MLTIRRVICFLLVCFVLTDCTPPRAWYPYTKLVTKRRATLGDNLVNLLPADQRKLKEARQEAEWLANTAYKAAAGISRVNNSRFPGWAGNFLVNTRFQDRGLCWHYQHDMYRELRRRKLEYFRVGCCVRDRSERTEHNCVYVAAKDGEWPNVWVLDAWMWNGRLKVDKGTKLDKKRWADMKDVEQYLALFYTEGHDYPVEHWYMLRGENGKYSNVHTKAALTSPQFIRMNANIRKGYREHPGSRTNY